MRSDLLDTCGLNGEIWPAVDGAALLGTATSTRLWAPIFDPPYPFGSGRARSAASSATARSGPRCRPARGRRADHRGRRGARRRRFSPTRSGLATHPSSPSATSSSRPGRPTAPAPSSSTPPACALTCPDRCRASHHGPDRQPRCGGAPAGAFRDLRPARRYLRAKPLAHRIAPGGDLSPPACPTSPTGSTAPRSRPGASRSRKALARMGPRPLPPAGHVRKSTPAAAGPVAEPGA